MSWLIPKALLQAYENSLSSRELAEESSEESFLAGRRYVLSKLRNIHEGFLRKGKRTESYRLSQSGVILPRSKQKYGEALLTWYRADFLAKTSVSQERAQELPESVADYGRKWQEWFAKYDQDLLLWKTPQLSLLEDYTEYLDRWPKSGRMRNGECSEQLMLEHRTDDTGCGFWPTPTVKGNYNRTGLSKTSGNGLATMVMMYPTPTKSDGTGGPGCSGREGGQNLRTAIKMWATPTKRDYKDSPGMASTAINPDGSLRRRNDLLPRQVYQSGETNGSLNPDWVEWLMGFPIGWTSLKPMSQKAMQDWECRVSNGTWWRVDPADSGIISRVAAKVPNSRHRIAAIGNAQVPVCAAVAYSQLRERLVDGS